MPSITEIYRSQAEHVRRSGVSVEVCRSLPTVSIESEDGAVFLQGDEAAQFLDEVDRVWNEAQDLDSEDAEYGHAYQYLDALS